MQFSFGVLFLSLLMASTAFSEPLRSVKAAGFKDKNFALYFEATYTEPSGNQNLKVQTAKVIVRSSGEKDHSVELICTDNPSILQAFQSSSSGAQTKGMVIGLECLPQGEFIFLLWQTKVSKSRKNPNDLPATCEKAGALKTKPVALATSFGHQAFCLEDWSSVSNPSLRFEEEFEKYRATK